MLRPPGMNVFPRYNGAWLAVRKSRMDDEAIAMATGVDPLTLQFMREVWADMDAAGIPASNNWAKDEARYDLQQEQDTTEHE